MAEPIPVYPQIKPMPAAGSQVLAISPYTGSPSENGRSFFDRASFQAGRTLQHVQDIALTALDGINRAATQMAEERPIQLVVGVGIAAFAAGSGLRIWRSHHE